MLEKSSQWRTRACGQGLCEEVRAGGTQENETGVAFSSKDMGSSKGAACSSKSVPCDTQCNCTYSPNTQSREEKKKREAHLLLGITSSKELFGATKRHILIEERRWRR